MSLFGVPSTSSGQALRLRLSQKTAPNSAQDDEFNYEKNFCDRTLAGAENQKYRDGDDNNNGDNNDHGPARKAGSLFRRQDRRFHRGFDADLSSGSGHIFTL
jgi:hypothetical protein